MNRKVAIYARVSTEHEAQLSALENQIQYYNGILEAHKDWELYDRYIDEGITGTSVRKRKNFLRMMEDALSGKFDLIITREVSRFARNTVDTLQQTRLLKRNGVEVYFTEDNIWTMNDDDGELKLTLMATLAQNESKKTSVRVKAGQAMSFENGVFYGNGNILGYDREGKDLVINEEQAKTVRLIYDLYLAGSGIRKIQYELENRGRLTATGKKHWDCSGISRILRNEFYCGIIVYRKNYVPDYLEQKKIRNYDQVQKVEVQGKHQPIVTEVEYLRVQKMLNSKKATQVAIERARCGVKPSLDVYCRKMKCECGISFNRKVWHRTKEGETQYAYQCYNQINTGTVATRIKKGLSTEGICDVPMVPGWKIRMMADWIFRSFWNSRSQVLDKATEMLEKHIDDEVNQDFTEEIEAINKEIQKQKDRLKNLVEMRMDGEISKDIFSEKKQDIEDRITRLESELREYAVDDIPESEDTQDRLKVLQELMEKDFDFSGQEVPEEIVDAFVDSIIVHKDYFEWNLKLAEKPVCCNVEGNKRKSKVIPTEQSYVGGAQHRQY